MAILKLKKPIMVDGKELSELKYDLNKLTPNDIDLVLGELIKQGIMVATTELDTNFHRALFALAAGIDILDMKRMSAIDYLKAGNLVRDFLLDSEESTPGK